MPKLHYKTRTRSLEGHPEQEVSEMQLHGFIDAANYMRFERALDELSDSNVRSLVLDFGDVQYINSTGISALIRQHELCKERGGVLCLAGVSKAVGLSMHLLGVTSLIPFTKDVASAESHIAEFFSGKVGAKEATDQTTDAELGPRKIFLREPRKTRRPRGKVLVVTPEKNRFTKVLHLRFGGLNGDYYLLHDTREALGSLKEIGPDLIVVDDRCDPKGEFVSRIKVSKDHSLTSIIKLYARATDVESRVDFKIWENDYLVDPFELLELFSLTEAELSRVPKDRKVFNQQVRFEFKTVPENVEKAYKLSDLILRQAFRDEESVTAMYAAVKEGIDNAVVHGNRSNVDKTIDVNFLVDQQKVTVIVEDKGKGFDYEYYLSRINRKDAFEEARKRILEEGIRGGLGILLMSKCSDRIEYAGEGNRLRLERNVS